MLEAALWGLLTAGSLWVGAAFAAFARLSERMIGLAMAFGAGALIATRAFTGPAPLSIHTRHGQVQMDAGRMMSRVHTNRTDVVALEGLLHFQPRELAQSRLRTGEGASFSGSTLERLQGNAVNRAAWQQGMLAVDDWPLVDVMNAIQAYYPGFIRVAPSVSGLRVFGIFQLDVQLLLDTLAQTLPVQLRRLGPLVSIDAKPAAR